MNLLSLKGVITSHKIIKKKILSALNITKTKSIKNCSLDWIFASHFDLWFHGNFSWVCDSKKRKLSNRISFNSSQQHELLQWIASNSILHNQLTEILIVPIVPGRLFDIREIKIFVTDVLALIIRFRSIFHHKKWLHIIVQIIANHRNFSIKDILNFMSRVSREYKWSDVFLTISANKSSIQKITRKFIISWNQWREINLRKLKRDLNNLWNFETRPQH
jgi:hypothetical protein